MSDDSGPGTGKLQPRHGGDGPGAAAPDLSTVLEAEFGSIRQSRRVRNLDELPPRAEAAETPSQFDYELVGLALSGGGIRSATFCLGVLQAFAAAGKLRLFDYLSTVSGGGYLGSAWSALLAKGGSLFCTAAAPAFPFVKSEDGSAGSRATRVKVADEPPALTNLRNFSNYLAPSGLMDYLKVPALLLRGLLVNAVIFLPYILLAAAVTLAIDGNRMRRFLEPEPEVPTLWQWWFWTPYVAAVVVAVFFVSAIVRGQFFARPMAWLDKRAPDNPAWWRRGVFLTGETRVLVAAILFAVAESQGYLILQVGHWTQETEVATLGGLTGLASGLWAAISAIGESKLLRRLAFAAVLLFGPLAFWLLYVYLCQWGLSWSLSIRLVAVIFLAAALVLRAVTQFININATSLHSYYRDRLSRAYLLTPTERDRVAHRDHIPLTDLDPEGTGGPYHLINAAENLPDFRDEPGRAASTTGDRSQRGRRSDFFIFGKHYCGNRRLGYCETGKLEAADTHLDLGTAMAISAAAASTRMGQKTYNPLVVLLLALLNVRLGYWLPTPKAASTRASAHLASVGPVYFLAEAFGIRTPWMRRKVNLSDGGHIENLAIFELLRRKCRYIVSVDAEADPGMTFNGLAVVQRLAYTDLGVRIDIDLDDIRRQEDGYSRKHWALGRIDYGDGEWGELLYIKSSLMNNEPEFIGEYRSKHPTFPHETTGDQFFDEAQFEAYRALGEKVGNDLLRPRDMRRTQEVEATAIGRLADPRQADTADAFFTALREWLRPAPPYEAEFKSLFAARGEISDLQLDLAQPAEALELYPELEQIGHRRPADEIRELRLTNRQLQVMERVIFELRLDEPRNQIDPRNRGWMNLFRRWGQAPFFRRYWALCIGNYSETLQVFCKYALLMVPEFHWRTADANDLTPLERTTIETLSVGNKLTYVATICTRCGDEGMPGFDVATATVVAEPGQEVLSLFRIRDTYRNMRLTEPLLVALGDHIKTPTGARPAYRLRDRDRKAVVGLQRVLQRLGFTEAA